MSENTSATDDQSIEQELDRILGSPEFANASRLKEFLSYVVTETRSGRADLILGKTIALDVYGREADAEGKGLSLVKVDAGRLRRRLDDYYSGTGADDPMRIVIQRGGYVPRFETPQPDPSEPESSKAIPPAARRKPVRLVYGSALFALVGLIALGAILWWDQSQRKIIETGSPEARDGAVRQALLSKSPATLQAANLAKQARSLIFPPTDPQRLKSALELFERAIELDPEYFGGHAGVSQVLGIMVIFSPPGEAREGLLAATKHHADTAVNLRPTASWSQSALAWSAFAAEDLDNAAEISARAVALDDRDYEALDFDGLIALFSGNFERAAQSSAPERHQERAGSRPVFRNIHAVASYHLGLFEDTIREFRTAAENGNPISQITVAYLAAAHYRMGNTYQAKEQVKEYEKTWPTGRVDLILLSAFRQEQFVKDVIEPFKSAGWSPP